ncbi:hypothetical protein CEV34_2956 [Brucella pseudogrignonensis]|uniref:Uncharacterized protein n=1 Tax=Brucella pseudogrignonensis TaxID=419475 RepID=A0A256GE48_9HYPH|nr:hypothetical protein CEV34_2956 [Brucella pseudogrignonensis]
MKSAESADYVAIFRKDLKVGDEQNCECILQNGFRLPI